MKILGYNPAGSLIYRTPDGLTTEGAERVTEANKLQSRYNNIKFQIVPDEAPEILQKVRKKPPATRPEVERISRDEIPLKDFKPDAAKADIIGQFKLF